MSQTEQLEQLVAKVNATVNDAVESFFTASVKDTESYQKTTLLDSIDRIETELTAMKRNMPSAVEATEHTLSHEVAGVVLEQTHTLYETDKRILKIGGTLFDLDKGMALINTQESIPLPSIKCLVDNEDTNISLCTLPVDNETAAILIPKLSAVIAGTAVKLTKAKLTSIAKRKPSALADTKPLIENGSASTLSITLLPLEDSPVAFTNSERAMTVAIKGTKLNVMDVEEGKNVLLLPIDKEILEHEFFELLSKCLFVDDGEQTAITLSVLEMIQKERLKTILKKK